MVNVPHRYRDLTTLEAREHAVTDLKELGLVERIEDYTHSVGHCQRCGTVVEPLISKQWFLSMKTLAEEAKKLLRVESNIIPEKWVKVYFDWLNNVRDWCISRQLWWGHRIPAYYCNDCGEVTVAKEKCGAIVQNVEVAISHQDEAVLDTWFSSALWPFATLGWPEKTSELEYYYPTTLLITGYDILFFWVARMIWSGMHFMKEEPFPYCTAPWPCT